MSDEIKIIPGRITDLPNGAPKKPDVMLIGSNVPLRDQRDAEVASLRAEVAGLQESYRKKCEQAQEYGSKLDAAVREVERLTRERDEARGQRHDLAGQVVQTRTERDKARAEVSTVIAKADRLTKEYLDMAQAAEVERDAARASLARVTEERDEARERSVHTREVIIAVRLVLASHRTYPQPACGCETCATLGRALEMYEARRPMAGLRNYGDEIDAAKAEVARLRAEAGALRQLVSEAESALTWASGRSPEAVVAMVKEAGPWKSRARSALRAAEVKP